MTAGSLRIAGGASIILLAVLLVYMLANRPAAGWVVCAAAMAQTTVAAWLLSSRWSAFHRAALMVALLALAGAVTVAGLPARAIGLGVTGLGHAVAYASLLAWFGASLRPGREPVVTGLARRIRRTTPDKVSRYTRQVTRAWCAFFAAQLAVSAALLLAAPVAVWSTFVTMLNLPLIVAMGLAEFGCRMIVFRHEHHTSLVETLSALRRARFMPAERP